MVTPTAARNRARSEGNARRVSGAPPPRNRSARSACCGKHRVGMEGRPWTRRGRFAAMRNGNGDSNGFALPSTVSVSCLEPTSAVQSAAGTRKNGLRAIATRDPKLDERSHFAEREAMRSVLALAGRVSAPPLLGLYRQRRDRRAAMSGVLEALA